MTVPILESALGYIGLGWSVFPLKTASKEPAIKSWKAFQKTPPDAARVTHWFGENDLLNIAVVLGPVSKIICRDFDCEDAYDRWQQQNRNLAASLPTVQSSRGKHVYAAVNTFPRTLPFSDGELRSHGSYVVLPPSTHPSGVMYSWLIPPTKANLRVVDLFSLGFGVTEEVQKRTEEERKITEGVLRRTDAIGCGSLDVDSVIRSCVPDAPGKREKNLFAMARKLLAIGFPINEKKASIQVFRQWYDMAVPVIGTKDYETSLNAFLRCCERVHTPLGNLVALAAQQASTLPPPVWATENLVDPRAILLASTCRILQSQLGDAPFFLSCRTAAEAVGTDHNTSSRWLQLFVRLGKLQVVETHTTKRAIRYRYIDED